MAMIVSMMIVAVTGVVVVGVVVPFVAMMVAVIRMAVIGDGAIGMQHTAIRQSRNAIPTARLFKAGSLLYAAIQPSSPGIGETRD